jgi:uncharacterized membrane protein HdeD (DUF308 family)
MEECVETLLSFSTERYALYCAVVHAGASRWAWMLISGIADLLLAGLIISGWPGTAGRALGLIVGVNLITSGLAITMAALAARGLVDSTASGTR